MRESFERDDVCEGLFLFCFHVELVLSFHTPDQSIICEKSGMDFLFAAMLWQAGLAASIPPLPLLRVL
jgi:hypothetical protein